MLGRGRPRAQQVCLAAVRRPGGQAARRPCPCVWLRLGTLTLRPFPGFCGLHGRWAAQVRSGWCYSAALRDPRDIWTTELSWAPLPKERQRGGCVPGRLGRLERLDSPPPPCPACWPSCWALKVGPCAGGSGPALPALLGSFTQSLLLWVWVALTVIIGCVKGDFCF